jgi:apolipoprotein N-acyltransferase
MVNQELAHLIYKTKWFRYILSLLSGVLLLLSFPPFAFGIITWIAFVPLFIAIFSSPTQKISAICGFITGFVFYTFSLSFFWEIFGIFGAILSNIFSLYIAIFALSCWLLVDRIGLGKSFFFIPIFWVGIEFFRSELYFLKFPWLAFGYSQAPYNILIQVCDIIGIYGLSFIILSVNGLISWFVLEKIRRRKWVASWLVLVAFIFVSLFSYGATRDQYIPKYLQSDSAQKSRIPVIIVQDMVGSVENYVMATYDATMGTKESLVIWPEVADSAILSTPSKRRLIEAMVRDKKLYLIAGTFEPNEDKVRFRNLAVLFSPQGDVIGEYAKQIPVQFVETIVIPGTRSGIFETPLGRIGILICYEGGFSNMGLRIARHNAEVIVIPTLELGRWGGLSHQHHASMIPFRAVETRRPILRSAALGVSMIVHPSGKVESQLNHLSSGVIKSEIEIPKNAPPTFYVKYGYLFPRLCLFIYSFYLVLVIIKDLLRRLKVE